MFADTSPAVPLLQLRGVDAFYGKSHVLRDVSLRVDAAEIVSVLGRNGSGRSTLLKAVMGLVPPQGSVRFEGQELAGLAPYRIARSGIGYVPEAREVFARLSVEQNLELGRQTLRTDRSDGGPGHDPDASAWSIDDMYEMFPVLKERRRALAGVLSGGEQQMLTLCRTLMGNPRLILVDEPTEGLAPAITEQVGRFLVELQGRGVAVLLVEQKLELALAVSQRCLVMGRGRLVFEGTPDELQAASPVRQEWLEV